MFYVAYWLLAAIIAYLFFGFSSLGDKLVLTGKPKPVSYTFYVGVFGLLSIFLLPFIKFVFPSPIGFIWIISAALVYVLGLYSMYIAIAKFEISKVVATIGATQPIFIFILTWIFWGSQKMSLMVFSAFIFLFLGSIIISYEKNIKITGDYLKITIFSSLMYSLYYIFTKLVFISLSFFSGIVWVSVSIFFFVLFFLLRKKYRDEIFSKQIVLDKKTQLLFLGTQTCGGVGNFLQSLSISLAPMGFLAIVNSLKGIQYIFLFFITLFVSYFYPKILKEQLSKKVVVQKILSIVLIAIGLALLSIN
jgi:drug/metabolite transporter (DMT)-like permease